MGGKTGKKEVEDLDVGFAERQLHICGGVDASSSSCSAWIYMLDSLVGCVPALKVFLVCISFFPVAFPSPLV